MSAEEAIALAFRFADGMRETGASPEAQAAAFVTQLSRDGFEVRPRIGRQGAQLRRPAHDTAQITSGELRTARASLGLSRAKLAEISGVDRGTLMYFETGRRVPHRRTLSAISAALDEAARPASTPARSDNP